MNEYLWHDNICIKQFSVDIKFKDFLRTDNYTTNLIRNPFCNHKTTNKQGKGNGKTPLTKKGFWSPEMS